YKDRGAVTLISYLKQKGIKKISEDSSGNAGAAIAAYAARAGIEALIYVPETAKGNKLRQIEAYGAKVIRVKGSREDVAINAEKAGVYYASHVLNPEFRDGIRTLSYEISRDLGWKSPDLIFLPVSAGTLLLGVYEGFRHLLISGIIEKMPKIIAVQTSQVMPVCSKLKGIPYTPPAQVSSVADALISTNPILIDEMIKVLKENGDCVIVDEREIIDAHSKLAKSGFFVEYSSATVYAAYEKYNSNGENNDLLSVLILTGHGLKTV
ncbi:MAG: pyridoxal-phosphate dependent enzyme, partial [Sulfolobales archaeon]